MANWKFEWFDRVDLTGEALAGTSTGTTHIMDMSAPPFNVSFASFMGEAPPFRPINQNVPLTPGSYLKFMDTDENEVDLTLFIKGTNRENLYNIIRGSATGNTGLSYLFSPVKADIWATLLNPPAGADKQRLLTGFGKLRVTSPAVVGGVPVVRDLICRCISGFKIRNEDLFVNYAFCPLTFYANQPYWRSAVKKEILLGNRNQSVGSQARNYPSWFTAPNSPAPGLDQLAIGAQYRYRKRFNITNLGDVPTPPIWTVTGPASAPVFILENPIHKDQPSILSFNQDCVIGNGQNLVINIENRTAVISGAVDGNVIKTINVNSQMWDIPTNLSTMQVRVRDSNNTGTKVKLEYYERFLGAY